MLPEHVKQVRVQYSNDPEDVGVLKRSDPVPPNEHETGWFERMSSTLNNAWEGTKDGANWTWEVLQGDFNGVPTVS